MALSRLFQLPTLMEAKIIRLTPVDKDRYVRQDILTIGPESILSKDTWVYWTLNANIFSLLFVTNPFLINITVQETINNKKVKHDFSKLQDFCDYLKSKNIDLTFLDNFANLKKYLTMEPSLPNFKNSASEPHIYKIEDPNNQVLIYGQMRR